MLSKRAKELSETETKTKKSKRGKKLVNIKKCRREKNYIQKINAHNEV